MQKSSLISILKQMSPEEIREAGYLVHSPFFNRNQSVVRLFDYLKKQYPDFEAKLVEKKVVYKKIFNTAYNDGFMRVLISNLTGLIEEYLTQINLRKDPIPTKILLLNELNLRKHGKEFRAAKKKIEKLLASVTQPTMHDFFQRGMLEDNIYFYNNWSRREKKRDIKLDENSLKCIIDNFTRFYLIASFTMYRKVVFMKAHENINVDLKFVEAVLKILENNLSDFADTPLISLCTNEVLLLTKGDRKYFDILKDIYVNQSGKFHNTEIYSLLNILQRHATSQILKGNLNYEREKFLLYKSAVQRKNILYPLKEFIEDSLFISIVFSSLSAGEISWTEQFVNKHNHLLSKELSPVSVDFCMAKIDFERGDFELSLTRLRKIKTKNSEIQIYIKVLLLKIYFEMSMYIESDLIIDSLRHQLPKAEKSMAILIFESYKNFLKYYTQLTKIKEKNKKEKTKDLLEELNANTAVNEYKWLKQKVENLAELENKKGGA